MEKLAGKALLGTGKQDRFEGKVGVRDPDRLVESSEKPPTNFLFVSSNPRYPKNSLQPGPTTSTLP